MTAVSNCLGIDGAEPWGQNNISPPCTRAIYYLCTEGLSAIQTSAREMRWIWIISACPGYSINWLLSILRELVNSNFDPLLVWVFPDMLPNYCGQNKFLYSSILRHETKTIQPLKRNCTSCTKKYYWISTLIAAQNFYVWPLFAPLSNLLRGLD